MREAEHSAWVLIGILIQAFVSPCSSEPSDTRLKLESVAQAQEISDPAPKCV